MTYQAFLTALKQKTDCRLFIICGENDHFKRESLKAVLKAKNADAQGLDVDRFDAKSGADAIILACETLPFISENRIVLAEDFAPLVSNVTQGAEEMGEYIGRISDTAVLIFYCAKKPDKRKKLFREIAGAGILAEFNQPKRKDLTAWVVYAFSERGKSAERGVADALIERCGTDMMALDGEVEKIASFVTGDRVSAADVAKVAFKSLEYHVFLLHDLLMKKRMTEALELLDEVLDSEKNPFGIMGYIAKKFRTMNQAKALSEAKYPEAKAIQLIGGHPYAARLAIKDAERFSAEELRGATVRLAELDYLYKTGQRDFSVSLAKTLMEIYRV